MKNRIIAALTAFILAAGMFYGIPESNMGTAYALAVKAYETEETSGDEIPSIPKASLKSGTYYSTGSIKVKVTDETEGAVIYYSLNGAKYRKYKEDLILKKSSVLKVYAVKDGERSKAAVYTYKFLPMVTVTPEGGTISSGDKIILSSTAANVKYYYTTDGSKPTTNSKKYKDEGISLTESCTLRIVAIKSGWERKYITLDFKVDGKPVDKDDEDKGYSTEFMDDYTHKYAYSTLNKKQKKLYAVIFDLASKHLSHGNIEELKATAEDLEKAYWAFDYDNPQFFWLANGYRYSYDIMTEELIEVTMQYSRSEKQTEALMPEFTEAAKKIYDKAIKEKKTIDRIKVIHDEIINMTHYRISGAVYESEADGALINGYALCEGYSKAFMYMCQAIGVECICVAGSVDEGHMWNMVKIDGKWYHVDVTFDDPVGAGDVCVYDYFCLSTADIKKDHVIDNFFKIPKSASKSISG